MYILSKSKIKYYYSYYNYHIFKNYLPPFSEIGFILKNLKYPQNWAEFHFYKNRHKGKYFYIIFKTKKFPSRKFFLEILLHEMVHLVDTLENGMVTGHGESFMKWRMKLLIHGFSLKKQY